MKKAIFAIVAAAAMVFVSIASSSDAEAQRRRGGRGGAVAVGIIGGIAAGAIIGGAIANSRPAYGYPRTYYPVAGYEPYPVYRAAPAYGCPGGYWARRPVRDQWGQVVAYGRPRFFCPAY